jgi:hypothetical protein
VVVSWLPLYHDMGLIGSYLGALYCGGTGVYMSPLSFIRRPPLWLELISTHKGTHMQVRGCGCSAQRRNQKKSSVLLPFAGLLYLRLAVPSGVLTSPRVARPPLAFGPRRPTLPTAWRRASFSHCRRGTAAASKRPST